jgi:putative tryptophan/tyrosine transport system substrate-binding protein
LRNCTIKKIALLSLRKVLLPAPLLLSALFVASSAFASDILIIGDVKYKPVSEVASGIKRSLQSSARIYALSEVRGRLASVVSREDANVVVALGKDAVEEAIKLPSSVAVIYGLIILPPKKHRHNMTGVYMSTPVSEYVNVIRKYLPSIRKISVVGSQELLTTLNGVDHVHVTAFRVGNSADLVKTFSRMGDTQALLLLPDVAMLSASVMENVYLFSYRRSIPLLGISEGNVKQGSLLALVFDSAGISEQIAEMADSVQKGSDISRIAPAAPRKYRLSLNINTARKMGIAIPESLLRNVDKIYE